MIRDRQHLDWLREQRCCFTGRRGHPDTETVDPMHVQTAGTAIKGGDDEAIPVIHSIHADAHQRGHPTVIRELVPEDVLEKAFALMMSEGLPDDMLVISVHGNLRSHLPEDMLLGAMAALGRDYYRRHKDGN